MSTTKLPPEKEKAHAIAQKIANGRPLKKDAGAPDANVSGGFNQKAHEHRDEVARQENPPKKGDA